MPDAAPGLNRVLTGAAVPTPSCFVTHAANIGIKDDTLDFSILASTRPCSAAGVFTRSLFAGPSVTLSRRHLASGQPRAIVTVSKNANVATGEEGIRNAEELAARTARIVGGESVDVLVGSTGVIGRPYPMARLRSHLDTLSPLESSDLLAVARAIMTTDKVPKLAGVRLGEVTVSGVAKGVGMMEPDMATLLVYLVTDAEVPGAVLRPMFSRVMDLTFNCLSIDTDTSTSDTALVLANGAAGPVTATELEGALYAVALSLTLQLARDGEGATKLLQVNTTEARDFAQAKRVGKAVVNSPLVKTAMHGADPNWGRLVMAIGKCSDDIDIIPERVRCSFGDMEVYPRKCGEGDLAKLASLLMDDQIEVNISLGTGTAAATIWGCDLSDGYIRINADYTT